MGFLFGLEDADAARKRISVAPGAVTYHYYSTRCVRHDTTQSVVATLLA